MIENQIILNPSGLCMCGCGNPTPKAQQTSKRDGYKVGDSKKFLTGHNGRVFLKEKNSQWKGGRIITEEGYVKIRGGKNYIFEHRYVMEQFLGRKLASGEQVHHINGVKSDNRLENLELWNRSQPNGVRNGDVLHCGTCTCSTT